MQQKRLEFNQLQPFFVSMYYFVTKAQLLLGQEIAKLASHRGSKIVFLQDSHGLTSFQLHEVTIHTKGRYTIKLVFLQT